MDIITQTAMGLFTGLLCAFLGYRLAGARGRGERRRAFKVKMRIIAEDAMSQHADYLTDFYERCRETIRRDCYLIDSDVHFFKRWLFRKKQNTFLSLTDADLTPPSPGTFKSKDAKEKEREFKKVCVDLSHTIQAISQAS